MLRLMGIRRSDVSANPLVVFVEDHAVAIVKRDTNLLPWTEMNVAGQQNFDVIVAVALAEQIGLHIETQLRYRYSHQLIDVQGEYLG